MTARAVHWHEGMFLRPQQFQAAERHAHELQARNCRWDLHHGWGLHRIEWEPEALATYRFALRALEARFPTLDFVINIPYVWKAVLIAFIGAILGALYPALKAASKDPIDALAYE